MQLTVNYFEQRQQLSRLVGNYHDYILIYRFLLPFVKGLSTGVVPIDHSFDYVSSQHNPLIRHFHVNSRMMLVASRLNSLNEVYFVLCLLSAHYLAYLFYAFPLFNLQSHPVVSVDPPLPQSQPQDLLVRLLEQDYFLRGELV